MSYEIIRYHQGKPAELVQAGLSLEAAQAHCQRADTHGPGWFDGYREVRLNYYGTRYPRTPGLLEAAISEYCRGRT